MGGRLSIPRGPAGTTEASRGQVSAFNPNASSRRAPINLRTILAPVGVVTLASLFFIYSRTSIQAAKENAKRHREADGGSISWRNEALRRHGALAKPEQRSLIQELFTSGKEDEAQRAIDRAVVTSRRQETNPIEEGIRKAREARDKKGNE